MKEKGLTTSGWKIFSIVNGLIEEPIKKKNYSYLDKVLKTLYLVPFYVYKVAILTNVYCVEMAKILYAVV